MRTKEQIPIIEITLIDAFAAFWTRPLVIVAHAFILFFVAHDSPLRCPTCPHSAHCWQRLFGVIGQVFYFTYDMPQPLHTRLAYGPLASIHGRLQFPIRLREQGQIADLHPHISDVRLLHISTQ
jgi:hypothetical protein